ncbi:hypothetical protein [Streptomyces sp. NPDC003032]
MTTFMDRFADRVTEVTTELATLDIPLTVPAGPFTTDEYGWIDFTPEIDRSGLAWCTAVRMLADHHHTPLSRQILNADALLRELGVPGLATLHRDLVGAPIDYRFTPCPYCDGMGEDPTLPTCEQLGCRIPASIADHPHGCLVCRGETYEPEYYAERQMDEAEQLWAEALAAKTPPRRSWRTLLHRR